MPLHEMPRLESQMARLPQPIDKRAKPYNVGKLRARKQLLDALTTNQDESQLRRLEQSFGVGGCRFDWGARQHMNEALDQAAALSLRFEAEALNIGKMARQLDKKPTDGDAASIELDAAMEAAAVRIQAIQRGKEDRKRVQQLKEEAAAQEPAEDEYHFYCDADESGKCAMILRGGDEGAVELVDDLGRGMKAYKGIYQLWADEAGTSNIKVELEDRTNLSTTLDWEQMLYASFN